MSTSEEEGELGGAMEEGSSSGGGGSSESGGSGDGGSRSERGREPEYFGWVYHLGTNSIGHEYCHLRFLLLRGKYVAMYKRDPHDNPEIKPIRKGVVSHTLMVEELGRRKINCGEFYVLRFYNRLDETKKGEIACATAGEAQKWMEAFDQAKQQAVYDLSIATGRHKLNTPTELNLDGHRPRVRRYAHGLKRLIRIGKGPEMLLRKTSDLESNMRTNTYLEVDTADAIEAHDWRCVRTANGIRIFEDIANSKGSKTFLLKAVGVVDASLDNVFEVVLSLDRNKRCEWDMLTDELELVDSVDGHCDVVYGTYDPKNLTWWHTKKDFVFSRQWFRGQDGEYTILQFPAVHKKRPHRSGYHRTKINPSVWEFRRLGSSESPSSKCLVTRMLEVQSSVWDRFKGDGCLNFEKTVQFALLSQVAGLKEYFEANPAMKSETTSTIMHSSSSDDAIDRAELEDSETKDEFYDAIANGESFEDEDSDDDDVEPSKAGKMTFKNVSWAIARLALKRNSDLPQNSELDSRTSPITIDPSQFHGSLDQGKGKHDTNCWSSPIGQGFMIRGKTYLKDHSKVVGGDPLLKLLAVDWLKCESNIDQIALHPKCLVQSEAGKKLPFILVINLQIPAKPNYSLAIYFGAEKPIKKGSLLGKFVDGTDMFRDSRFKLIPSIVEGYWMVKRAVGTKACLLGKAVTCRYLRQDNFLEIDVDIGSSSVARSIISLVLGYVTAIVVDLAILIEATEENELPEYILGSVRLNRLKPESAVTL
ncbi:protein ENHANCED DISEASE RESISTANCE 2 isoform X1 [Iris pallida]|uniref:Protein ENHANCED DISEASE RESISTANCE 2 isoform X1 n=1 Tax=Iris pallida TaxID=29817 RepID=A0AAX6GRT9_IRIPA|nr:protein ENHANCED DISEASE RESISTANCE 2 isoform X1 [Iris pallida]